MIKVAIALVLLVIALVYLAGAWTYPLIPAGVDVATSGRVDFGEQAAFMTNPGLVVTVIAIVLVGAIIAAFLSHRV